MNKILLFLKIILLVIFVWIAQVLFLYQASKSGFNGWDDWGQLFYYEVYNARDLRNLPFIINETGTPYMWTEEYNIGPLKDIFGLNQKVIKLVELLFKSLAALSIALLAYKFTKDRLLAIFVVFFFIIFPSTAGVLSHIIFAGAYLTLIFICAFIVFYFQSLKNPKKIVLASLFFFLALLVCPPRAYLILPVPFLIELYRLRKGFNFFRFLRGMIIFYSPLIFLQSRPGSFIPHLELVAHIKQIISGNLYSLSFPFQAISALFLDKSILNDVLKSVGSNIASPYPDLRGIVLINFILIILSLFFGFTINGSKLQIFAKRLFGLTVLIEVIFLILGFISSTDGKVTYINYTVGNTYTQTLGASIYQAFFGAFYTILGLLIALEWWFRRRGNKILAIILVAWIWSVFSEVLLYFTNHWYYMTDQSYDRYIIVSSMGAVVFIAGVFSLFFKELKKIKDLRIKYISLFLIIAFTIFLSWKNYKLMGEFYHNWNEEQGWGSYWQDKMHQRFLHILGKENLNKSILIYIDDNTSNAFNEGSFIYTARFRLFYDLNDRIIRDNCKGVISNIDTLKKAYTVQNGEKGFLADSICVNPVISFQMKPVFYPLNDFYAYKIENKNFIKIKDEITLKLEENK